MRGTMLMLATCITHVIYVISVWLNLNCYGRMRMPVVAPILLDDCTPHSCHMILLQFSHDMHNNTDSIYLVPNLAHYDH